MVTVSGTGLSAPTVVLFTNAVWPFTADRLPSPAGAGMNGAVDVGQAVSPDGLHNRAEGGIIWSAGWAFYEQTAFDCPRIDPTGGSSDPIPRLGCPCVQSSRSPTARTLAGQLQAST